MTFRLALAFCLLLGSFSAAQAAFFSDDEARKKIAELQQQLSQLQTQVQGKLDDELKQRQTLDGRVSTLEGQLKSQGMIDLLNQIERINGEVTKLKGQIEVMAHDVEVTQKRQRDLYTDLDGRLRKLEGGAGSAAAPASAAAASATATETPAPASAATPANTASASPAPPVADAATELKDYEAAHTQFKAGKHAQAAEAFEKFLTTYPDSKYAPNAQYWIGYAHFSQKNYKASMAAQQKLLQKYPDHQKAPDAMYNIANSQIQLADIDGARKTLKDLVTKYPLSEAAPMAKKRLAAIESLKSKN